jgi:hypothetical protein
MFALANSLSEHETIGGAGIPADPLT